MDLPHLSYTHIVDAPHVQNLVSEEEPLMTNTLLTEEKEKEPNVEYIQIPITQSLLDSIISLNQEEPKAVMNIRYEISLLIQNYCRRAVSRDTINIEMYQYDLASSQRHEQKVVNWFGVILKVHQILIQTELHSVLRELSDKVERDLGSDDETSESQDESQHPKPKIDWIRFIIYWRGHSSLLDWKAIDPETNIELVGMYIPLEMILFTLNAHGTYDHYLQAVVLKSFYQLSNQIFEAKHLNLPSKARSCLEKASKELEGLQVQFTSTVENFDHKYHTSLKYQMTDERYRSYLNRLISNDKHEVDEAFLSLEDAILALISGHDRVSLRKIEQLLVGLVGSVNSKVVDRANRLLNLVYDGSHWQVHYPFETRVACVGDRFSIEIEIPKSSLQNFNPKALPASSLSSSTPPSFTRSYGIKSIFLLLRAPPVRRVARIPICTRHRPIIKKIRNKNTESQKENNEDDDTDVIRYILKYEFSNFHRCGYFDWRFVILSDDGSSIPLYSAFPDISHKITQGRYVVQTNWREEVIHQVFIDIERGDSFSSLPLPGTSNSTGSFRTVIDSIPTYVQQGITTLHLFGALERCTGDTFDVATDSSMANKSHGGSKELRTLVDRAHQNGLKVVLDAGLRIRSKEYHRKYGNLFVKYLNNKGQIRTHLNTDGNCEGNVFVDSLQLNFRKLETWNLFVTEFTYLVRNFSLDGLSFNSVHLLPSVLPPDYQELSRLDPDGQHHYTPEERLFADIVIQKKKIETVLSPVVSSKVPFVQQSLQREPPISRLSQNDVPSKKVEDEDLCLKTKRSLLDDLKESKRNEMCGYWGSSRTYPNPFFVKILKELWEKFPEIGIFTQTSWFVGRELESVRCGLIPYDYTIRKTLEKVIARKTDDISALYRAIQERNDKYPPGAVLVNPITTFHIEYSMEVFKDNSWPVVELFYLLDGIPATYLGDHIGRAVHLDVTNRNGYVNLLEPRAQADLGQLLSRGSKPSILGHFQHRTWLRKQNQILQYGTFIPMNCYELTSSTNPQRVFAFARILSKNEKQKFSKKPNKKLENERAEGTGRGLKFPKSGFEVMIIVINFGDQMVNCCVDYSFLRDHLPSLKLRNSSEPIAIPSKPLRDALSVKSLHVSQSPKRIGLHTMKNSGSKKIEDAVYVMKNLVNPTENHYISYEELQDDTSNPITLAPLSSYVCKITPATAEENDDKPEGSKNLLGAKELLIYDSLERFIQFVDSPTQQSGRRNFLKKNQIYQLFSKSVMSDYEKFQESIEYVYSMLKDSMSVGQFAANIQKVLYWIVNDGEISSSSENGDQSIKKLTKEELEANIIGRLTRMVNLSSTPNGPSSSSSSSLPPQPSLSSQLAESILKANKIGPIVFICPELGQWSTVGGLGVMVDELTQDLAVMGCDVHVISPYYNINRKGVTGYLNQDGIRWVHNLQTWVGSERVEVGVHEGRVNGIHLLFLHHLNYFPHVYPSGSPDYNVRTIVLMAKASLEAICSIKTIPAIIITNDWFTGLVPAYARSGAFGSVFQGTTFLHLIHNLGDGYQGWVYPERSDQTFNEIHHLDNDLLFDPLWSQRILNPSRCAILCSDTWATVSKSYKDDLLNSSSQSSILSKHSKPFATSNGIRKQARTNKLLTVAKDHDEAKSKLQSKYFGRVDPKIPVFSFVGRITSQKGVHLICESAEELIRYHEFKVQIIVGGPADPKDLYASDCASSLRYLRHKYPQNFWGEPDSFFTDGPLVNLGSDFGLMPSLFEPGGVVQHEFFVAGTPVIAFKTGGLKDTVFEWQPDSQEGNGFTFEAHHRGDFMWAFNRAVTAFHSQPTDYRKPKPESGIISPYYKLRQNACDSVIDTTDVAYAWFGEFSRLRKRLCARESKVKEIAQLLS